MPTNTLTEPAATSETLNFENARAAQALYVNDPQNLRKLEERFAVKITTREGWIKVDGAPDANSTSRAKKGSTSARPNSISRWIPS